MIMVKMLLEDYLVLRNKMVIDISKFGILYLCNIIAMLMVLLQISLNHLLTLEWA
ncbi:Uncharacterised protein [Aeromonas hydrophila]|nr:Uncharacterised protein [Aeromonas hydrophila]